MYIMKGIIFTLFLLVFSIIGTSFTNPQQGYVYRDLGTYVNNFPDGSSIQVGAYITKSFNRNTNYQYKYVYTLIGVSKSIYGGRYKPTWLYNTRVFMNNVELTHNQHPDGYTAYVDISPSVIYYWYTNDENIGTYYFSWGSSAYETK